MRLHHGDLGPNPSSRVPFPTPAMSKRGEERSDEQGVPSEAKGGDVRPNTSCRFAPAFRSLSDLTSFDATGTVSAVVEGKVSVSTSTSDSEGEVALWGGRGEGGKVRGEGGEEGTWWKELTCSSFTV